MANCATPVIHVWWFRCITHVSATHVCYTCNLTHVIKQNNLSLVICVAISLSLGWWKNTWARRVKVICCHPKRSDIAIQYTSRRLFCFYILLFNGFKSFQAEINMYLLLYFILFKSQCRNTSHCNTKVTWATLMQFMWGHDDLWRHQGYNVTSFYCYVIILVC